MAVSPSYRDWIEDLLGRVEPVRTRAMFGGLGIYARERFFALAADDVLYFKVDESTRPAYQAAGMGPFRPYGPDGPPMNGYHQVPPDVLEDAERLAGWMEEALQVAAAAGSRGRAGPPPARRR